MKEIIVRAIKNKPTILKKSFSDTFNDVTLNHSNEPIKNVLKNDIINSITTKIDQIISNNLIEKKDFNTLSKQELLTLDNKTNQLLDLKNKLMIDKKKFVQNQKKEISKLQSSKSITFNNNKVVKIKNKQKQALSTFVNEHNMLLENEINILKKHFPVLVKKTKNETIPNQSTIKSDSKKIIKSTQKITQNNNSTTLLLDKTYSQNKQNLIINNTLKEKIELISQFQNKLLAKEEQTQTETISHKNLLRNLLDKIDDTKNLEEHIRNLEKQIVILKQDNEKLLKENENYSELAYKNELFTHTLEKEIIELIQIKSQNEQHQQSNINQLQHQTKIINQQLDKQKDLEIQIEKLTQEISTISFERKYFLQLYSELNNWRINLFKSKIWKIVRLKEIIISKLKKTK